VAGEVEGDGDQAVARQRVGEGKHQRFGAGEAMRDDDDWGFVDARAAIDGGRDVADRDGFGDDVGARGGELPDSERDRQCSEKCEDERRRS
jgi:hypothetical protein